MLSLSCFSELPPTLTLNSDSAGDLLTHSDRLLPQAQVRVKASDLLHQYISNITSSSQILKSSYIRKPYIHKVRARLVANSSPSKWYKPATAKIIPASILMYQHLSLSTSSSDSVNPRTSTVPTDRKTATSPTLDSGRAHDPAGLANTKTGELMVICWECPFDGLTDRQEVDPKYRFLYMLILAVDTNFKLQNKLHTNERFDPPLGSGWGTFVEPTGYREHLKGYISTCIVFTALLQKDTQMLMGLQTSGVSGCMCVRHECVHPNGLRDLQKGAWKKNLADHNKKLPERIRLDLDNVEVQYGLQNLTHGTPMKAELCLALKKEEEEEMRKGRAPMRSTSATAFLLAGMQLEDAQLNERRLMCFEQMAHSHRNGGALLGLGGSGEQAFMAKLAKFQKLQETFTLGAVCARLADEAHADPNAPPTKVELIRLYMPLELGEAARETSCEQGIVSLEICLRESQCHNALVLLHSHLHTKHHLIGFHNVQITGQVRATKAATLIGQVGDWAAAAAERYRQGCLSLTRLAGPGHTPHFKELQATDMSLDGEEMDAEKVEGKKLAMMAEGKGVWKLHHVPGTSKKILSWIWTASGALEDDKAALRDSLRVEWCRVKAREVRWEEEVLILREEM
ncbi:hypothetical protein DFH07DRAFT_946883, partial [Mycena maculata]